MSSKNFQYHFFTFTSGIFDIKKKLIAAKKAKIQKKVEAITKLFSGFGGLGKHGATNEVAGSLAEGNILSSDNLQFSSDVH